ncbi:cupin domain-containing protein [Rubrobacter indicoceani]|uniref:cupin domain-containing protein n=1 Tax=Rubrobacter indicoceani TaxID=2051957 RepID=UPI000E5AD52B
MQKVNVGEKLSLFRETWTPKVVGALNGQHVKVAKLLGEFVWHHHEDEDELFLVVKGKLDIEFRDREAMKLGEGEFVVVPRGVEHRPVAKEEAHVLLFEPDSTLNTGNVRDRLTIDSPDKL